MYLIISLQKIHRFFPIKKSVTTALALVICAITNAQVDYNALPDYDYRPPVKKELAIPNANSSHIKTASGMARSKGWARSGKVTINAEYPLPDHWNNALMKHFPPYFYQAGPSCMCSSFIGYILTHELNAYRNLDGQSENNQMAVFFSWLQTFQNSSKEDISLHNGCPSATVYGGRTNSDIIGYYDWRARNAGWMQGYDNWYSAMFNRSEGYYTFPYDVSTNAGREAVKRWVYNHNGDTDFLSGGLCYVTVAANTPTKKIASTPANDETGAVGKMYIHEWSTEINHAMTIIGYDDRLEFDLDEDGIYGEEDADEKGAWIVANSWGEYWGNGGWTYVPYRYGGSIGTVAAGSFWRPYITYIRKDYIPKRTIKIKMDYDHRSELYLYVGVSSDTAATMPAYTLPMTSFKNAGDGAEDRSDGAPEVPMLGMYKDGMHHEPMEFGYDLTDLSSGYDNTKPVKYFFTVKTTGSLGRGHIYNASIMDYRLETKDGMEIPFNIDTVVIDPKKAPSYVISVVVPGEAINPPTNASLIGDNLTWDAPKATSLKIQQYYIYKGRELIDSVRNNLRYKVSDPQGAYSISAVYAYKTSPIESERSNQACAPQIISHGNNMVLNVSNGSLIVPNAVPSSLYQGTIEFWFKPHVIGTTNHRLAGSNNDKFFICATASGQIKAGWNEDNCVSTTSKTIKANTWVHVAVVVNKNIMTLYVNGMRKGTVNSTATSGIPALGDIIFGTDDNLVDADIDELRVWNTAHTQLQIYANKDKPISSPSNNQDLMAYLPMNTIEIDGQTFLQEYINSNHGYIENAQLATIEDPSILNGSNITINPSIELSDSVYTATATQLIANTSVTTTKWQWSTPGARIENYSIQSPYVIYDHAGEYTATLTVTNDAGEQASVQKTFQVLKGSTPEPNFDISAPLQQTGKPISFINRTLGVGCTYTWEVEGQGNQYLTNINATFSNPGKYNVTLTATNSAGAKSITKQVDIYVARPQTEFNIAPNNILLGETTYLEDHTTGTPNNWLWTISNNNHYTQVDGQFSSFVPKAPGYYDVTLQTSNEVGSTILKKSRALCVSNAQAFSGLNFVGNNEQLQFCRPFARAQSRFTMEWWMCPTALAGAAGLKFGPLQAYCSETNNYCVTYGSRTFYVSKLFVLNEWHHYAITYDRGTFRFYRDGILHTTYNASSFHTLTNWGDTFTIGRTDDALHAYIDEMRIWSSCMTADQIKQVCNSPIADPANTNDLCLYYDFNQNGGDVIDRTGHGYQGKRINFGPDGDAWITQSGVFTLDFTNDIVRTDVANKYLTNYKAPFIYNKKYVNLFKRKSAYEFQTETDKSTWIFKEPRVINPDSLISTLYVDTLNQYALYASSGFDFGEMINKRLYQTITLPQGHYVFSVTPGNSFSAGLSRIVVCEGDSIVTNNEVDNALASCMLTKGKELEFDVTQDQKQISLGIIYNLPSLSEINNLSISQFNLYKISSTTQIADGINSAYDAVEKGKLDNITGEHGAIRVVSDEPISLIIYNAQGQCIMNDYVSGNKRIPLTPGIYIANGKKIQVQ